MHFQGSLLIILTVIKMNAQKTPSKKNDFNRQSHNRIFKILFFFSFKFRTKEKNDFHIFKLWRFCVVLWNFGGGTRLNELYPNDFFFPIYSNAKSFERTSRLATNFSLELLMPPFQGSPSVRKLLWNDSKLKQFYWWSQRRMKLSFQLQLNIEKDF